MTEVINYQDLITFLNEASLHEIYKVSSALFNELENPARVSAVKNSIKMGQEIEYFDGQTNQTHQGIILSKDIKYVSIRNVSDRRIWKIPYHMLVVDAREFDFSSKDKGLTKNEIKVGDIVGFNKDGEQITGRVERLNQKTVTLYTHSNHKWRVAYALLFSVIDGKHCSADILNGNQNACFRL